MKYTYITLALAAVTLVSCNDKWDEHYGRPDDAPSISLMEMIAQRSDLSIFAQCVRQTGAAELLSSTTTSTVWAPNNDALSELDLTDSAAVQRVVSNHIAPYSYPSTTASNVAVAMLNGKSMHYTSQSVFNGNPIFQADNRAENGILHVMSMQIPYQYNLREYLETHDDYSHLREFIQRFDEVRFDAQASTLYDSVFVNYNCLLQDRHYGIGHIHDEDSAYTMVLPSNAAWDAAVEHLAPYHVVYNKDAAIADSIQQVQTRLDIVNHLVMRGRIADPATQDSLLTTRGGIIRDAQNYLGSYEREEASNGMMYLAQDQLVMDDSCTWNPVIVVEAEDIDSRTTVPGSTAYIRTTDANSAVHGVSRNSYLEVTSSSLDGGITFNILGVLAGKYDIYCDFIAPEISGASLAAEQTRVQFQLRYQQANGSTKTVNVNSKKDDTLLVGGEDSHGIIPVLAYKAQEFPVSNQFDNMWFADPNNNPADAKATVTLQVKTNVGTTELGKTLMRRFRLDKIRFVPVTE